MSKRKFLPRKMWADIDPHSKEQPVVIYATKKDQRGCRPDLKPIPVLVLDRNAPTITIPLTQEELQTLNQLYYGLAPELSTAAIVRGLVDAAMEGVRRPGSWEREWLYTAGLKVRVS